MKQRHDYDINYDVLLNKTKQILLALQLIVSHRDGAVAEVIFITGERPRYGS